MASVVLATAVWGEKYVNAFANLSAASLLARDNLPKASAKHEIIWQLITPSVDAETFRQSRAYEELQKFCRIEFVTFESLGYDRQNPPGQNGDKKYGFLSELQNIALMRAADKDLIFLNYADCIWSNGTFSRAIDMFENLTLDAIFTYGIAVDWNSALPALDQYRTDGRIEISAREACRLSIEHLHSETRLRFWENQTFTNAPSFLIWEVPDEGIVVRAMHQTPMALRVRPKNPIYQQGIEEGTLDGNYAADIAQHWSHRVMQDSDEIMIFTLHDAAHNSALDGSMAREEAVGSLMRVTPISQLNMLRSPITFKARFSDMDKWASVLEASERVVDDLIMKADRERQAARELEFEAGARARLVDEFLGRGDSRQQGDQADGSVSISPLVSLRLLTRGTVGLFKVTISDWVWGALIWIWRTPLRRVIRPILGNSRLAFVRNKKNAYDKNVLVNRKYLDVIKSRLFFITKSDSGYNLIKNSRLLITRFGFTARSRSGVDDKTGQ